MYYQIYKFFEKPGEYVVENLAYSFLVEWSADLIATIPDTVDNNSYLYFSKINKTLIPFLLFNGKKELGITKSIMNFFQIRYLLNPFIISINYSLFKRILNSSFLLFIQQLCEPDLDYINRKQKGIIFWEIFRRNQTLRVVLSKTED